MSLAEKCCQIYVDMKNDNDNYMYKWIPGDQVFSQHDFNVYNISY